MQHQDISLGAFDQDRQGFLFAFLDFGLLHEDPFPVIPDIEKSKKLTEIHRTLFQRRIGFLHRTNELVLNDWLSELR